MSDGKWERTRWLQMLTDEGVLWMETSSAGEVRQEALKHPDWPVYRVYKRVTTEYEGRPVSLDELAADCVAEDDWYRKALRRGDVEGSAA
ncbi:hypothetical protein [Nocardia sp. NPDC049707]|uniref:hypothetical protein n=1 Tax=Nocardia sp. NPDC049707 TaxID=3154735 RepID=UPI00341C846C